MLSPAKTGLLKKIGAQRETEAHIAMHPGALLLPGAINLARTLAPDLEIHLEMDLEVVLTIDLAISAKASFAILMLTCGKITAFERVPLKDIISLGLLAREGSQNAKQDQMLAGSQ